ncbi:MAG: DUF3006 domain-containing protein [Clostridia bacterium]|nr:DUF3006 domain-containing protein [Clostridia bacterium]
MEKFFVDRIEENTIFCEDENGEEIMFDLSETNGKISECDVVFRNESGCIQTDFESTLKRKKKISNLKKCVYKTKK